MDINSNSVIRSFWLLLGLFLSFIGLVGIVVPGLPTTPIMILAAACFFRSSKKLYDWILNNKSFGKHVKNYREGNGMPKRVKNVALIAMWSFVTLSVFFGIPDNLVIIKIITVFAAATGTRIIINLPSI